jgi:uncharacterized protein (DUF1330 family)
MKTRFGHGLAMLGGAVLGGGLVGVLRAQALPPAYYIALVDPIDAENYAKEFSSKVPPIVKEFGGKNLARGGTIVPFDGDAPKRVVVVAFDSMEKVRAWQSSDAMKALAPARAKYSTFHAFAVEGEAK